MGSFGLILGKNQPASWPGKSIIWQHHLFWMPKKTMYWKLNHVKPKPHTKTGEFLLPNHHQYPENGIAPSLTRPKAAPWWLVDMTLVSRWRCDQKTLSHLSQQEANPLKPMANCLDIMQPYATNANHFRWLVLLLIYCILCANTHPHLHLHLQILNYIQGSPLHQATEAGHLWVLLQLFSGLLRRGAAGGFSGIGWEMSFLFFSHRPTIEDISCITHTLW
jgi:hypothetical protein